MHNLCSYTLIRILYIIYERVGGIFFEPSVIWPLSLQLLLNELSSTFLSLHKFLHLLSLAKNWVSLRIPLSSAPDSKYKAVNNRGGFRTSNESLLFGWFSTVPNQICKDYPLFYMFHSFLSINNCILFSLSD